jgi:ComF family protein
MISAMTLKAIAKNLINLLYPRYCESCKKSMAADSAAPVCVSCAGRIKKNAHAQSESKDAGRHFTIARSACIYEGILKELIHSFKYKGKITLAEALSSYMIEAASSDEALTCGINAVTFVPMQDNLISKRDYNHSQVLAGRIARALGLPLVDVLKKIRRTRPQNELSREERLTNLIGAFGIRDKRQTAGLKVLLIDDVMTTGATFDECAKILMENGAKEVRCLALSRGI